MLHDLWSDLRYRLRAIFRRSTVERELDDELRFHIEREAERLTRSGIQATEARRQAALTFGGVEQMKEATRDARGTSVLEHMLRDLAHSFRVARKQPSFALIVVLSLALGLGVANAAFNLTYNVLFAPLALPHPDELAVLGRDDRGVRDVAFSWNEYVALRATPGVGTLVATRGASAINVAAGANSAHINMYFVEGAFFSTLGVRPLRGRLLTPNDDERRVPAAVISPALAEQLFPGDTAVLGRSITIRGVPFTVVGVTPSSFRGITFPGGFSAAIPLGTVAMLGQQLGAGHDNSGMPYGVGDDRQGDKPMYGILVRLAVQPEAARAALALVFPRCCATDSAGARQRLEVIGIRNGLSGKGDFRKEARLIFAMLLSGIALILGVVCCNIASLLLVRSSARRREIAVRLSLGASRARLVSQLVLESVPLALAGGALGLVVAAWSTSALVRSLPSDLNDLSDFVRFQYGPTTLVFTLVVTLACAIAFAVYPALRATRQQLAQALRLDSRASRSRRQGNVARGAVVGQIAFTVVLVTSASLLAVSLGNLARVDGGFATENIALASIEPRGTRYEQQGIVPFYRQILQNVGTVPGVQGAGIATMVPLYGGSNQWIEIDVPGQARTSDGGPWIRVVYMTPGYLGGTGIRLLAGRDFSDVDNARGEPVAIATEGFARKYIRGNDPRDALGRSFALRGGRVPTRIVGIAADAKYQDLKSPPEPMLYLPLEQSLEAQGGQLVVRTNVAPSSVMRAVISAIDAAAPGITVRRVRDMRSQREAVMTVERLAARLAIFVSAMALVLSAVGLYGVVAYSVARRTSEIGVRLALGARARAVLWLVARETVALVAIGVGVGLPLSFAANGAMDSQLFGVGAHDPFAAIVSIALLAAVGLIASMVPARRATRVDPKIALSAD
ncbi:MAG TPA: ADOP family duplicated permease [Gemmatimonadaceae bacterium]|nr:ADOP family duplicated permease [Gemmatimonadaceae bacterium]